MKIKPCPFCGSDSVSCEGHFVECDNCGSTGEQFFPTPNRKKAIEAWNRRA